MEHHLGKIWLLVFSSYFFMCIWANASTYKLNLIHRDFTNPSNTNIKVVEKLKLSIERSHRRAEFLNYRAKMAASGAKASYRAPVWAESSSYLTNITIGGSQLIAIVDTGSDLVWRDCRPCIACIEEETQIFDPSLSSTYRRSSCDNLCMSLTPGCVNLNGNYCVYQYIYADTTGTLGVFSYDTLTLAGLEGEPHTIEEFGFGCSHYTRGDFSGAGGVIGLGKDTLSLISQLSISQFSYCLTSILDDPIHQSAMFLGDNTITGNGLLSSSGIITNPSMKSLYYVNMTGISVGGYPLDVGESEFDILDDGSGGVVIDSGTTITYFKRSIYQALVQAFEGAMVGKSRASNVDNTLELCYERIGEGMVPSLAFHFDGISELYLPFENYFVNMGGDVYCLAIAEASDEMSIFGNIQQQNFHILYDLTTQKLFFSPTNCTQL